MGQLTLITGGTFSGKSAFAETLFASGARILFISTVKAETSEHLKQRIQERKSKRPDLWSTVEAPLQVSQVLNMCAFQYDGFLIECIPQYMWNFLQRVGKEWTDSQILVEIERTLGAADLARGPVVIETREVTGVVPPTDPATQRYHGLIAAANQRLVSAADEVYHVSSGISQKIK